MSIATFRYGTATVSFVEQPYGRNRRRVISNAPLCRNGIDDMIAALTEARDHLDGDEHRMTAYTDFLALKKAGFTPPQGRDRCPRCALHVPTQGHRDGCPTNGKRTR